MAINFLNFGLPEDELLQVRHALYHSSGPGYWVFRRYLSPEYASHIVEFWKNHVVARNTHRVLKSKKQIVLGCPNFVNTYDPSPNKIFFNFLWNNAADQLTHSVALQLQFLRNLIESKPIYDEIYPLEGRSFSYRVLLTREGDNIVAPHRDYLDNFFDPKRLQATLFLTEPGKDFTGDGFVFTTNQKDRIVFGRDVPVEAGDLTVWRYNNEHSIQNVRSTPEQPGFVRMIFPPEQIIKSHNLIFDPKEWVKSRMGNTNSLSYRVLQRIYRTLTFK